MAPESDLLGAVLFVCTHNAIRSPMAAELMRLRFGPLVRVDSAGIHPSGGAHPLAAAVMDEIGGDLARHRPKGVSWFERNEEGPFELIVSLSPEAHHHALGLIPHLGPQAEYWPTFDPTLAEGSREHALEEFRLVRDGLERRIAARFMRPSTG